MAKAETFQIILTRVTMTGIRETQRVEYVNGNARYAVESAPEVKQVMWLAKASIIDIPGAQLYADSNDWTMHVYPACDRKAWEKVKDDALTSHR